MKYAISFFVILAFLAGPWAHAEPSPAASGNTVDHLAANLFLLAQQIYGFIFKATTCMHAFDKLDLIVQIQFVVDIAAYQIILHISPAFRIFLSFTRER